MKVKGRDGGDGISKGGKGGKLERCKEREGTDVRWRDERNGR